VQNVSGSLFSGHSVQPAFLHYPRRPFTDATNEGVGLPVQQSRSTQTQCPPPQCGSHRRQTVESRRSCTPLVPCRYDRRRWFYQAAPCSARCNPDNTRHSGVTTGCRGRECRFKSTPAQNLQVITIHDYLCCMGVLCMWVKLLTDLQILGCELHKNAFCGWASYSSLECSSVVCSFCAIDAAVPPRPQGGTVSVIVLFTIVFGCVTDCNCNL